MITNNMAFNIFVYMRLPFCPIFRVLPIGVISFLGMILYALPTVKKNNKA